MEEEFSCTESENTLDTAEFSQDEFDNVEVEAPGDEATGRSYENQDDSLEPYRDEPLADEEWVANYRKKQEENQKVERELKKRLENRVLVREWYVLLLYMPTFVFLTSLACAFMHVLVGFLPQFCSCKTEFTHFFEWIVSYSGVLVGTAVVVFWRISVSATAVKS